MLIYKIKADGSLPGAQWLIDDFSLASATLFIFLIFFQAVRFINWDMGTLLLVGFIPQIICALFQWSFHNVMRYRLVIFLK